MKLAIVLCSHAGGAGITSGEQSTRLRATVKLRAKINQPAIKERVMVRGLVDLPSSSTLKFSLTGEKKKKV